MTDVIGWGILILFFGAACFIAGSLWNEHD